MHYCTKICAHKDRITYSVLLDSLIIWIYQSVNVSIGHYRDFYFIYRLKITQYMYSVMYSVMYLPGWTLLVHSREAKDFLVDEKSDCICTQGLKPGIKKIDSVRRDWNLAQKRLYKGKITLRGNHLWRTLARKCLMIGISSNRSPSNDCVNDESYSQ